MTLSGTIVNVAVPDVMGAYGVGQDKAQFLQTAFIATMTASQLLNAWVIGRLGQRGAFTTVLTLFLIGGLIVTETVFNIPGMARFLVEAIQWRDYPIVQNLVMFIALVTVLVNFAVDLLYAAIDPRIRYSD